MKTELTENFPELRLGGGGLSFPLRFGRKVGVMLFAACFLFLLLGAVPLWFSYQILESSELIRQMNNHIRRMEVIRSTAQDLVELMVAHVTRMKSDPGEFRRLGEKLLGEVRLYEDLHHHSNSKWIREGDEKDVFAEMQAHLVEIVGLVSSPGEHREEVKRKVLALKSKIDDMDAIHMREVNRAITAAWSRMHWILYLYFAPVLLGGLVIAGGVFWISHSIVRPVKRLAAAAEDVANGDFAKRVEVSSRDEIGRLSHIFNRMAARLEEHERFVQGMATFEERERLAREMHDGLAQDLGFLNLKIAKLQQALSDGDRQHAETDFRALKETVDLMYSEVRQAIFGLRVTVSRQLGFFHTLGEYIDEFNRQTGIRVDFSKTDEQLGGLPQEIEVQLIRIIQEALTNVRKHAQASRVTVTFHRVDENLEVIIEDNGCGLSQTQALSKGRTTFGIQTMEERARSVRGSVEVHDAFPLGTRVTVRMPLILHAREA